MTGTSTSTRTSCVFCRAPDDLSGMNLATNCKLSDTHGGRPPCAACTEYISIEAKISAARRALDDLVAERWEIRARVNRSHDLMCRRVPTEIVRSVFQFCLPVDDLGVFDEDEDADDDDGDEDRNRTRAVVEGPLVLGRVCRTWRNIAWKTEPLWTVIRIFLNRVNISAHYIQLVKEWLDRAGHLPLSLRISKPHAYSVPTNDAVIQLLALINARSRNWKTLDVFGSRWFVSQLHGDSDSAGGGGGGGGAPDLQSLRIKYSSQFTFDDDDSNSNTFSLRGGAKPRPSRLVLDRCDFRSVDFEWTNLTSACLSHPLLDASLELLRLAPGIVSYRLYEITRAEKFKSLPKPDKPTIYPSLESLELDCDTDPKTGARPTHSQSNEIAIFFEHFAFPNLAHLKVNSGGGGGGGFDNERVSESWAPVIANLERSSPPLKSLSIQYLGPHPFTKCILPIMQLSPLLEDLEITTPFQGGACARGDSGSNSTAGAAATVGEYMNFFHLFNSPSHNAPHAKFLPNLHTLSLSVHRFTSKDTDQFWSHICDIFGPVRWYDPRPQPLQTLRVSVKSWYSYKIGSEDIAAQVLDLQNAGTVLEIVDENGEDVFNRALQVGEPLVFDAGSSWI